MQLRYLPTAINVLAILLAAAAGATSADAVQLRLTWTPYAAHIPVYVAKAKGYYDQNNLDVTIVSGRGSTFAVQTVGSGNEPFGLADAAATLTGRARGVPIVAIANLEQDNGLALFATAVSGISKVEDLRGRNLGVYTGSTTAIYFQALLRKHGMTLESARPVTMRAGTDLPLLLDGKIDAMVGFYNSELAAWAIEQPQLKLRHWRMRELGFDTPGIAVVTNETMLKQKPAIVKAFAAATVRGLDYAVKNPDEAVQILVKGVPELKASIELAKWQATAPGATGPATAKEGLGALDRNKWDFLNELLKAYAVYPEKVDLGDLLKPSYR